MACLRPFLFVVSSEKTIPKKVDRIREGGV